MKKQKNKCCKSLPSTSINCKNSLYLSWIANPIAVDFMRAPATDFRPASRHNPRGHLHCTRCSSYGRWRNGCTMFLGLLVELRWYKANKNTPVVLLYKPKKNWHIQYPLSSLELFQVGLMVWICLNVNRHPKNSIGYPKCGCIPHFFRLLPTFLGKSSVFRCFWLIPSFLCGIWHH